MKNYQHNLAYSTDKETGRVSVGVALSNYDDRAWLFEDDYRRITAQRGAEPWFLNSNGQGLSYVRVCHPKRGSPEMVARLVTGEQPRRVIKYWDGNRLNLRGSNLLVAKGHGGAKHKATGAAAFVAEASL